MAGASPLSNQGPGNAIPSRSACPRFSVIADGHPAASAHLLRQNGTCPPGPVSLCGLERCQSCRTLSAVRTRATATIYAELTRLDEIGRAWSESQVHARVGGFQNGPSATLPVVQRSDLRHRSAHAGLNPQGEPARTEDAV